MLRAITVLLVCQLIGEVVVRALALPVPGPVVGMFLLYAALSVRRSAPATLARTSNALLQHLSLLYVPAGVGVMVHFALIRREWLPIALTLVLSTLVTLVVTALTLRWLVAHVPARAGGG